MSSKVGGRTDGPAERSMTPDTAAAFGALLLVPDAGEPAEGIVVYACDNGVHTDLIVPVVAGQVRAPVGAVLVQEAAHGLVGHTPQLLCVGGALAEGLLVARPVRGRDSAAVGGWRGVLRNAGLRGPLLVRLVLLSLELRRFH